MPRNANEELPVRPPAPPSLSENIQSVREGDIIDIWYHTPRQIDDFYDQAWIPFAFLEDETTAIYIDHEELQYPEVCAIRQGRPLRARAASDGSDVITVVPIRVGETELDECDVFEITDNYGVHCVVVVEPANRDEAAEDEESVVGLHWDLPGGGCLETEGDHISIEWNVDDSFSPREVRRIIAKLQSALHHLNNAS